VSASLVSTRGAVHAPDDPASGATAAQVHDDHARVRAEMRATARLHRASRRARRRYRGSRVVLALLLFLTLAASARVHGADDDTPRLPGTVVGVLDGDTVDVRLGSGMMRVRLHAIDTPERGQPYGDAAKDALSRLVFGKAVELEPYEQDRYDRLVARIWMGELDVNAQMVRDGYAWAYRRYVDDVRYCIYEYDARQARRGLWKAPREQSVAPWEWRRRKTLEGRFTDYTNQSVAGCISEVSVVGSVG